MARFLSDDLTDRDKKKMEKEKIPPKKRKPLPPVLKTLLILSLLTALFVVLFFYVFNNRVKEPSSEVTAEETVGPSPASDTALNAEGTVIILQVDSEAGTIRFKDPKTGDEYVLNATGSTIYEDLKGTPMVMEQLIPGDIVDIVASVHSSNLKSVKLNEDPEFFEFRDITDYSISTKKGVFTLGDRNYRILEGTVVLSSGAVSSFKHIKEGDVLTIKGIGNELYTVTENSGNGYVKITGAESFKGGWIQLGPVIRPIEDEMVLTVPEGSYTLNVSYMHFGGTKNVNVTRGKETRVTISDLKGDLLKTGTITFAFEPMEANPEVSIDGKRILKEDPVELDYGVHTLDIKAEGYMPIHKYLKVGEPMANLTIILEKEKEDTPSANSSDKNTGKKEDESKKSDVIPSEALPEIFTSKTTSSSSSKTDETGGTEETGKTDDNAVNDAADTVTTDTNQLYIDGPEGAEVYFDGAYKGIAPCHFRKSTGTHVITLMKTGYETRSYTLNLSAGNENESYSFNDLTSEDEG